MTTLKFATHTPAELERRLRGAAEDRGWALEADPHVRVYELRHPRGSTCRLAVWPVEGGVQVARLETLTEVGSVDEILRTACRRTDPFLHEGAMEGQMSTRGQIPQRIDKIGTKVEELAGTGEHDSPGG